MYSCKTYRRNIGLPRSSKVVVNVKRNDVVTLSYQVKLTTPITVFLSTPELRVHYKSTTYFQSTYSDS